MLSRRCSVSLLDKVDTTAVPYPPRTPEYEALVMAWRKALPDFVMKPQPLGLAQPVERMGFSAEHGNLTLQTPNDTLQVGDLLDFVVGYGDATVYLHDMLYGIRHGIVETAWVVQGRGKLQ